jgi:hypothetical protein
MKTAIMATALLRLLFGEQDANAAEATVITLSGDGTAQAAGGGKPEPIKKMGLVVNLTERTVSSFSGILAHIDSVDATNVLFNGVRDELPQSNQIVGGGSEGEGPPDAAATAELRLLLPGHRLDPAECLFDALADALADGIAAVPRRSSVDCRTSAAGVLRYMRRHCCRRSIQSGRNGSCHDRTARPVLRYGRRENVFDCPAQETADRFDPGQIATLFTAHRIPEQEHPALRTKANKCAEAILETHNDKVFRLTERLVECGDVDRPEFWDLMSAAD